MTDMTDISESQAGESAVSGEPLLLEAIDVHAGYGRIPILRGVNLRVARGEIVALLGANGAGKSTTLHTLGGDLRESSGEVRLFGTRVRTSLHRRARQGVCLMPEERAIIPGLSVRDNLRMGKGSLDDGIALFPVLRDLLKRKAGLLSGGEQQMLALARAVASQPEVLLIDEVSMGLAPLVIRRIYEVLRETVDERGFGVLIVDQQLRNALGVADRAYVMARGHVVLEGSTADLRDRADEIEERYLGLSS